jgi:branched-chain amino acid transport system ATP-binding protein
VAEAPLLQVRGLVKRFSGLTATDNVDLEVLPGEVHALIGPNGAGKTTFIAQLSGELRPDAGSIHFGGADIGASSVPDRARRGLARTFQITQLLPEYTALEHVALAVQARRRLGLLSFRGARSDASIWREAAGFLDEAGFAHHADARAADLSHGDQKQLELVIALAARPRLALLDEPMAGLGQAESAEMIERLRGLKGTLAMLLVEHDLDAVFALADRISVLVYGRIIATGGVAEIRDNPEVRTAYLGEGDE